MDQSDRSVRVKYFSIFHPNISPLLLGGGVVLAVLNLRPHSMQMDLVKFMLVGCVTIEALV